MKRWPLYFIFLLFSIWLGIKIHNDPGIFFVQYRNLTIETTLWFALLSAFIAWLLFQVIWVLMGRILNFPNAVKGYFKRLSKMKSEQNMLKGISCLLEEEGTDAKKYFIKAAQKNLAFINYLLAAMSAHIEGNNQEQIRNLDKASLYANNSHLKEALEFFRVKQALEASNWSSSLSHLLPLYEKKPNHPTLLKWLKKIYLNLEEWEALYKLLPKLKKITPADTFQSLESLVYSNLLKLAVKHKGLSGLTHLWKTLPSRSKKNPQILISYVSGLKLYGLFDEAEKLLIRAIKRQPDITLLHYYSQFESSNEVKQITYLESVLSTYPSNWQLLYDLGCLCAKNQLWGKAEDYLKRSLEINPSDDKILFTLSNLFLQRGEFQKALELVRKKQLPKIKI